MFEALADYIVEKYASAKKIVEIGVGHRIEVARRLKENLPKTEIIVTDKDDTWLRQHHRLTVVKSVVDDATRPRIALYQNASLIYSLHPPFELVSSLEKLSDKVGSDLLIVPIADEQQDMQNEGWTKIIQKGRTIGLLRQSTHPK